MDKWWIAFIGFSVVMTVVSVGLIIYLKITTGKHRHP